jgi:hypothetical protein
MSESTSGPSRRRKAPPNPYKQADQYQSLALFLTARGLPVPSILQHPAQGNDRLVRPNKRHKTVEVTVERESESNLDVCSHLLVFRCICH